VPNITEKPLKFELTILNHLLRQIYSAVIGLPGSNPSYGIPFAILLCYCNFAQSYISAKLQNIHSSWEKNNQKMYLFKELLRNLSYFFLNI
jgi:hypothetical protein